ncbi:ribonuclease HII [Alphaproteobacteria bacterium]
MVLTWSAYEAILSIHNERTSTILIELSQIKKFKVLYKMKRIADATLPNFSIENKLGEHVLGIDEAGRGPLSGPVVAACALLNRNIAIPGINDSKILSEQSRLLVYESIIKNAHYGIGIASVEEIDQYNILEATFIAMQRAVAAMKVGYEAIMIDGNQNPFKNHHQPIQVVTVVGGDRKSLSIAAASIIAKVTRDVIMTELSPAFPEYSWHQNKGYGTKKHVEAIRRYGITEHHRKLFIRKLI